MPRGAKPVPGFAESFNQRIIRCRYAIAVRERVPIRVGSPHVLHRHERSAQARSGVDIPKKLDC
jgi:hypothetical protein